MSKTRAITVGLIDALVLTSLALLGPFATTVLACMMAILTYCIFAGPGFLVIITTISHITQFGSMDENLIRAAKWGMVATFFGIVALRLIVERRKINLSVDGVEIWFIVFLFWAGICSFFAVKPGASFGEVFRLLTLLPIYFISRHLLKSLREVQIVLLALLLSVIVAGVASAYQVLDLGVIRVRGLFQNANMLGVFMTFALPGLFIGHTLCESKLTKILYKCGMVVGFLALLLSWSRDSYLAVAVQLVAYLILAGRKRMITALSAITMVLILLVVVTPALRDLAINSLRLKGGTTHRTTLWKHGFNAFTENPVFGVGFEVPKEHVTGRIMWNSLVEFVLYSDPGSRFMPHNTYIYFLMSTGVIGLLLLIKLYLVMIRRQIQIRGSTQDPRIRNVHDIMIAMIVGTLAYGFFETSSIFGHGSWANYFWVLLGMSESLFVIEGNKPQMIG